MTAAFLLTVLVCFSCFPSSPRSTSVFACVWTSFENMSFILLLRFRTFPKTRSWTSLGDWIWVMCQLSNVGMGQKWAPQKNDTAYIIAKSAKKIGFLHYFDLWANRSSICMYLQWFPMIPHHCLPCFALQEPGNMPHPQPAAFLMRSHSAGTEGRVKSLAASARKMWGCDVQSGLTKTWMGYFKLQNSSKSYKNHV